MKISKESMRSKVIVGGFFFTRYYNAKLCTENTDRKLTVADGTVVPPLLAPNWPLKPCALASEVGPAFWGLIGFHELGGPRPPIGSPRFDAGLLSENKKIRPSHYIWNKENGGGTRFNYRMLNIPKPWWCLWAGTKTRTTKWRSSPEGGKKETRDPSKYQQSIWTGR